jgi:hypothetical protein
MKFTSLALLAALLASSAYAACSKKSQLRTSARK